MNSNGKRMLVLILAVAALALGSSAVVAFLASSVDNYGVPETYVGPGAENVLSLDVQIPANAVEDPKYFDGKKPSGIGDEITPFDPETGLAGFINAGMVNGETGVAFLDNAMFTNAPGYPGGADGNLDPGESIWQDIDANGKYSAGETLIFSPSGQPPLVGTPGLLIRDWMTALGLTTAGNARAYFRNVRNLGVYDANEIIFFDVDGTAPAGTFERETVIYPNDLSDLAKAALAGTAEVNTFGASAGLEVWSDVNEDGNFTVADDIVWNDTQANNQYDGEVALWGFPADGAALTSFPADARFQNTDNDREFENGEAIWRDNITVNNQFDAGEIVILGVPVLGDWGLPNASLLNTPVKFVDNVVANGVYDLGEAAVWDANNNNVYNAEPMLVGAAPLNGTPGVQFNAAWSFSAGYALIWTDADNDNKFDFDPIVYNPIAYTGDEKIVVDGGRLVYNALSGNWELAPSGILSMGPDTGLSIGYDGVNAFPGAPLWPLAIPVIDVNGVTHRTRFADTAPAGFNGGDLADGTAQGDEIFDDWDNSMTYTAAADVILVNEGPDLAEGAALTEFGDLYGYIDLSANALWNPGPSPVAEPIIRETVDRNTVLDPGEAAIRSGGPGSLTDFSVTDQLVDLNQGGGWTAGEPVFRDADNDSILDVGESIIYPSGQFTLVRFDDDGLGSDDEFFLGTGSFSADDDIVRVIYDGLGDNSTDDGDAVYNFSNDHVGKDDIYFADTNGNLIFDSTELLFWDRNNDGVYDPYLSTFTAGSTVGVGDFDIGDSLNAFVTFNLRYEDTNGSTFPLFGGEPMYISANAAVDAGDQRVFWYADWSTVNAVDSDVSSDPARAKRLNVVAANCKYYDANTNGVWDSGISPVTCEPIYYNVSGLGINVAQGDIRLTTWSDGMQYFHPGSAVGQGDWEIVTGPTLLTVFQNGVDTPIFYDENNNNQWDIAVVPATGVVNLEPVYADNDFDTNITAGDQRVTSYREGSFVLANAADAFPPAPLTQSNLLATDLAISDQVGGGRAGVYDVGDIVYYRGTGWGFPTRPIVDASVLTFRINQLDGDWFLMGAIAAGTPGTPFSEDLVANGVLDAGLVENSLDETVLGVDLNRDGDLLDPDVAVDLNRDGDFNDTVDEDSNGNGILDAPNAFWVDDPGTQPYPGVFRRWEDILTLVYNGSHVVANGEILQDFQDGDTHFDDGGLAGPAGNGNYDYGEAIIFDADADLRADLTDIVRASGLANNLDLDNTGPIPAASFVDIRPRDGVFQYGEAVVVDTNVNEVWDAGEFVTWISEIGAVTRFDKEKYADNNAANGVFDNLAEDIIFDGDDGGTFSTRPDAIRKDVPGKTTAMGFALTVFPPDHMFWNERVEVDPASPVNGYDYAENDEIFRDLDRDEAYTAAADRAIFAGLEPVPAGVITPIYYFGTLPNAVPPVAGNNILAGWVDDDGDGNYDGASGAEEDIYSDDDQDGVVDTWDDLLTSLTITNPYQAQEPADIEGVFVWTDADGDGLFDPAVDTNWGQALLVAPKAPGDNRTWVLDGVEIPAWTEDRNHNGSVGDLLDETVLGIDYNLDGDLLDVVDEKTLGNGTSSLYPAGKRDSDRDSQTNLFVTIDISDDPQAILMGNNFDATIPVDGMLFASMNHGPTDMPINNAAAPGAGLIHIDNNAPSVTKISDIRLFGFFDVNHDGLITLADGVSIVHSDSPPNQLFGNNEFEIASPYVAGRQPIALKSGDEPEKLLDVLEGMRLTELDIFTPSDNDVLFIRMQYAPMTDPMVIPTVWTDLNYDPAGDDAGDGGAPGFNGLDDDSDWVIANDTDGDGRPSVGEVGVDEMDPQVAQAIAAYDADFVDNDQDGYVDDFEYEAPNTDLDNDGVSGEGFAADVDGDGIAGEPDPTPSDNTYTASHDDDEDGVDGIAYTDGLGAMDRQGMFFVRDNFNFVVHNPTPLTTWTWAWDTYLTQLRLSGNPIALVDKIWVKAIAYDQAENVVETYAAPTIFWLDNTAPAAQFKLETVANVMVPNNGTIYDDVVYHAGAICPETDVQWIELLYAKNNEATFANLVTDATHPDGRIHSLEEEILWTPDPVTNSPADAVDEYYFVARASDRLEWYNITTNVWQPYVFPDTTATDTTYVEIGNQELVIMGNDLPPALAELHETAVDGTPPTAKITMLYNMRNFEDGVRVPAYNAVEIWVEDEDLNENGAINNVTENDAETYMGCDLNGDGVVGAGVVWDMNGDGLYTTYSEDLNGNGVLENGIDDHDGTPCQNDVLKIEFEYTNDHVTWVPIATVTGTIDGSGHVVDFSYPVVVTWDTTDPALFPEGEYDVRAVAYDIEGNADPYPMIVTVTVDRSGLNAYFDPFGAPADSSTVCGLVDLHSIVFGNPADDVGSTRVLWRYIRGEEQGPTVADIVFLIDSSSSMQNAINQVKAATSTFVAQLALSAVDYRLALVDLAPGGAAPPVILQNLTNDPGLFSTALNSLNVLPDALCATYDAMVDAASSTMGINWRADSERILLVITDTVPELGSGSGIDYSVTHEPAAETAMVAAIDALAKVFAITDLTGASPGAVYAYDTVTNMTGGLMYDINAADYGPVLADIAGTIVSGFWTEIGVDEDADIPPATNLTAWQDYFYTWDTSGLPDGWVMVEAIALDTLGNSDADRSDPGQRIRVYLDNTAPTPVFAQPVEGTVISENNGNTILEVLINTDDDAGTDEVMLEWSMDGVTWKAIDGINNDEDFFVDNPTAGLLKMYEATDAVYKKGPGNTDLTKVEIGDIRQTAVGWTVPAYLASSVVNEYGQDVGLTLYPLLSDGVIPDPAEVGGVPSVDSAPERSGPWRFVWLTKNTLGDLDRDVLVFLRATASQECEGGTDLSASTQIMVHVTDNSYPETTLITLTEPDGDLLVATNQTLDNTLSVFATAKDWGSLDEQGSVMEVSLWYRPREMDLDADSRTEYDLMTQPGATGETWMAWTKAVADTSYPYIFDWDVSGLNGMYEIAIVAVDSPGNQSPIDEIYGLTTPYWLMITHMEATVTDPLDATVNEGAIVTISADLVSNPVDDMFDIVRFYKAPVTLGEELAPVFKTQGTYAGFWVAKLEKNAVDPDGDVEVGTDVRVDVGGSAGVYHTFADLAAMVAPSALDFAVDYGTDEIIFGADPGAEVAADYHNGSWALIVIGDEQDPYTVDWQTNRDGTDNGVWSIMARAETRTPMTNAEPPYAEWAIITVLDSDSPNFHVGGLGHQDVDDPSFYEVGVANLGNSINEASSLPPVTKLSGDEVDLLLVDDDAPADPLDPTTVRARLVDEATGTAVIDELMTPVAYDVNDVAYMPVTFSFYEADWYHLVEPGDFENVTLWLDRDADGVEDLLDELYPMTQTGSVWATTVAMFEAKNLRYQFLVDTIGDNFDINGDGVEEPIDDPRNDTDPMDYEATTIGEPTPWDFNLGDSRIIIPSGIDYWMNADISALPDGVYRWEFTGTDGNGFTTTVGKRVVIDRTPITQVYAVQVSNVISPSNSLEPISEAPAAWNVILQAYVVDVPGGVNIVDPTRVLFQYFDGEAWRYATVVKPEDENPWDGWAVTWATPVPGSLDDHLDNDRDLAVDEAGEGDGVDNDNDGTIDEADEAESVFKLRAVVFDDGFNVSYTPVALETPFTIDGKPAQAEVKLASVNGASPLPVAGAVIRIGDPVTFYGQTVADEAPVAVVFQWSLAPASTWHDIDVTAVDETDDYLRPIQGLWRGRPFETPDFDDDTEIGGANYFEATLYTESIRRMVYDEILARGLSGDAYVEVRALAVDKVGNVGEEARTSLIVLNDMDGPVAYFWQLFNLVNGRNYFPSDPLMAFSGQALVTALAVGVDFLESVSGTLQISPDGSAWEDVSTVPLVITPEPAYNDKIFTWTMDTARWTDGTYWLRALVRDADGNIGGDTDGNGVIDGDERVPMVNILIDHTPPAAVLIQAGGLPLVAEGTTLIIPDLLPEETQFVPVLPSTVTFRAEDDGDSSTDIADMRLQFRDDYRFPREDESNPRWLTIGTFEYRDYEGNDPDGDQAANGQWILEWPSVPSVYNAMVSAFSIQEPPQPGSPSLAQRAYQFRPLAIDYAGNDSSLDPGMSLFIDAQYPLIVALYAGTVEMEGGGTNNGTDPLHVAGGDDAPLGAEVDDDWDIAYAGYPFDSGGMYGVRMEYRSANSISDADWTTIGLMDPPTDPAFPYLWRVTWMTPTNVAWADSLFDLRATARDSAGNISYFTRLNAVDVQDVTAPCNTRIVDVWPVGGSGSIVPVDVTETTLENGTWVAGGVELVAATAAGDQSMVARTGRVEVRFEAHLSGTPADQWILIESVGDTTALHLYTADGTDPTAGDDWKVLWNTLAIDGDGNQIYPDGHWHVRAYAVDVHGNSEKDAWAAGTCSPIQFDVYVDNTAPMITMDFNPATTAVETEGTVERNQVFTAFGRTQTSTEDVTATFLYKLHTDLNVPQNWMLAQPGYDDTDVNPDPTRPYSFDWDLNQMTPMLTVGAAYDVVAASEDLLGNADSPVTALADGRGILVHVNDTIAPKATITQLIRAEGDVRVVEFPEQEHVRGALEIWATVLTGDHDTEFVEFFYRPEGTQSWILADGDRDTTGDFFWVLRSWDTTPLAEGRYDFAAIAEDDAGNRDANPNIVKMIVDHSAPTTTWVAPDEDLDGILHWQDGFTAAVWSIPDSLGMLRDQKGVMIPNYGPDPRSLGDVAPHGTVPDSLVIYVITITSAGDVGEATFNWMASNGHGGSGLFTGAQVPLEGTVWVQFTPGMTHHGMHSPGYPDYIPGDTFTFSTDGRIVDLITISTDTDVWRGDDTGRPIYEYKRASDPDDDPFWTYATISPSTPLNDDILNTYSTTWDISGLESCLYDLRVTYDDRAGNRLIANYTNADGSFHHVVVDNIEPEVAITNINNAGDDTTVDPVDFGTITDVTLGTAVKIHATADDDEPCIPASHETWVDRIQFQVLAGDIVGGAGAADIVWVVDGSASMGDNQAAIAANAQVFADALVGVDMQLGVVAYTDGPGSIPINTNGTDGLPLDGTGQFTTNAATFAQMVQAVGSGRGGSEDAITACGQTLQHYTFRQGATKFFIIVSDEGDNTSSDLATVLPQLLAANVTVLGILQNPPVEGNIADYLAMVNQTGGTVYDILGDFADNLAALGIQIAAQVGGGGWQDLGTVQIPHNAGDPTDVTAYVVWNTTGLPEGTFYLRAKAWDSADNLAISKVVQVNVIDKTPPIARIAGFDPDVIPHGDEPNTESTVYALTYSDDEITEVQFQYDIVAPTWPTNTQSNPDGLGWINIGIGTEVIGRQFPKDNLWMAKFNLSAFDISTVKRMRVRALAKDSDGNRDDINAPVLVADLVVNPDHSRKLVPVLDFDRITNVTLAAPSQGNVVLTVSTADPSEKPKAIAVSEDLEGNTSEEIVDFVKKVDSDVTWTGVLSLAGIANCGEMNISVTALAEGPTYATPDTVDIEMQETLIASYQVTDALGTNGVVSIDGLSVFIPSGCGVDGCLLLAPTEPPTVSYDQGLYVSRFGHVYDIEWTSGGGPFDLGYNALVTMTYDDADLEALGLEGNEALIMPRWLDQSGDDYDDEYWSAVGVTHVAVDKVNNIVTFRAAGLDAPVLGGSESESGVGSIWSLFVPTKDAPVTIVNFEPWSFGFTDRSPVILAYLYDYSGEGIDEDEIEVLIDGRIVAAEGTGYVLGNGDLDCFQVNNDGTVYEVTYEHSTRPVDWLTAGQHTLNIRFRSYETDTWVELDPAAFGATFGVDRTAPTIAFHGGFISDPILRNIAGYISLGNPMLRAWAYDNESGIHIREEHSGNVYDWDDGIKYDLWLVDWEDDQNDIDEIEERVLLHQGTADELVPYLDPALEEYTPSDSLRVSMPIVGGGAIDDRDILEVTLYGIKEIEQNSDGPGLGLCTQLDTLWVGNVPLMLCDGMYFDMNSQEMHIYIQGWRDEVGNSGSAYVEQRYIVDTSGPTVELLAPKDGDCVSPTEGVTLHFRVTDIGSGFDTRAGMMTAAVQGPDGALTVGAPTFSNGTVKVVVTASDEEPLSFGTYTGVLTVKDKLGNVTNTPFHFTVCTNNLEVLGPKVFPNPFNPDGEAGNNTARLTFTLGRPADVSVEVYDFAGDKVASLMSRVTKPAGPVEVLWGGETDDGGDLANGVYIIRLTVKDGTRTESMNLKAVIWRD